MNDPQVIFEGVAGTSYKGDIAIDDVSFSPECVVGGTIPGILFIIFFHLFPAHYLDSSVLRVARLDTT